MQLFKNILVIVNDENTAALTEAATLARRTGATLTVTSVVERLSDYLPTTMKSASIRSLSESLIAARTEQLGRMVADLQDEGLQISVRVLSGTPFLEIIREVLRAGHDLVMITPYEEGALRTLAFGSTILHLMRKCPCPVWAIKSPQGRFSRIMAAVDPVSADAERNSLNFKIVDIAAALARIEGAELHIWHTWVLYGENMLRGPWFNMSSSEINRLASETRKEHQQHLSDLLRNYDLADINHHVHLSKGEPATLIPRLAVRHKIDLIVMGTVSRTGISGLFIGSTAENVLRQVNMSVLAVKPEGFVSPVTLDT